MGVGGKGMRDDGPPILGLLESDGGSGRPFFVMICVLSASNCLSSVTLKASWVSVVTSFPLLSRTVKKTETRLTSVRSVWAELLRAENNKRRAIVGFID